MKLTAKQEAFCQAIASGKTQADAYRAAYKSDKITDNAIYVNASRLLDNTKVALRVEELRRELSQKHLWTREKSVKALITAYKISNEDRNTGGMIGSVKELNAMHGYNEPQKIDHTTNGESLNTSIVVLPAKE